MIFSPFAYKNQVVSVGPTPTPTPTPTPGPTPTPTPPPTTVTWKYRYVANADGTTRQKTASNLYFTFQDVVYTRSNITFTGSRNSTETITTDTNTGTGQFDIYRDLCRGSGGSGNPKIDEYSVRVYRNGSSIYFNNTNLLNPSIPICPTQDIRYEGTSGGITVSAGDEIIVEWTDNLTV